MSARPLAVDPRVVYRREKAKRDRRTARLLAQARAEYEAALAAGSAPTNRAGRHKRALGIVVEGAATLRHREPAAMPTPKRKLPPKPGRGRRPLALPERRCEHCREPMRRKRKPNGAWEQPSKFRARRFCSRTCADAALTRQHDAEIQRRRQSGESLTAIAAAVGISRARVSVILRRCLPTPVAEAA